MTERKNRVATSEAVLDLLGIDYRGAAIISVDLHMDAHTLPVVTVVSYIKGDITHSKRVVTYRELTDVSPVQAIAGSSEQDNTDDWK